MGSAQQQMENQRNSGPNPILTNTSRQFYTRRLPHRSHSNAQLDKILKILNQQSQNKSTIRTKTQHREDAVSEGEAEWANALKLGRVKVQNAIKRHPQCMEWRQLYQSFQQFKRSTSLDVIVMNQVNFLNKLEELVKGNRLEQESSTSRTREGRGVRQRQGKLSLEAIKLHKQNQILKEQLDNFEHKERKMETVRNLHVKTLPEQPETLSNRISEEEYAALTQQLEYLRQANTIFRDEKRVLMEKINQLKASNENLSEEVFKLRSNSTGFAQRSEIWRNIMAMQNEEIISLKRDIGDLKREFYDLYRKYSSTIKRIAKLNSNNHQKLNEITVKTVEVFTEQAESFQRIRGVFAIRGFYNAVGSGREPKELLSLPYKKYLSDKDALNNAEGIKKMGKEYYRYFKPSFFVFLQKYFEYQGVDKQNFEHVNLSVGMHYLTTLRAILDSKHNEYLLARKNGKQFSTLSSFTISWLCNYKIDHKTRKQQEINTDVCFQTIGSFYARLMSNQLNGNWQVITFREFLLQTLTVDELAFYLKARFKLMKGDSLVGSGAFLQVCYVNYLDALLLIQEVVADFDYRKKLEEYIKRSVEFQRKKQLIDAHFILRLLLEYYQYHKSKVFATLSKTFINFTRDKNTPMPFQSYLKIYDYNFFEMSLNFKVEIYQKAFSLGRGVVNLQNIFTILNEDGYLCNQVQKKFAQHMIFEQAEGEMICQGRPEELESFQSFYQTFCDHNMNKQVSALGLQSIKMEANSLKITKNLSFQTLFERFQFIHKISMLTLQKLFQSKRLKQHEIIAMIPIHLKFYKNIVKSTVQKGEILSILEDYRKKSAARAIMKFYRKKKGNFVKSYLLSTQNMDKTNKMQQIRKQFTNIIDNIKKKYNSSKLQQTINEYDEIE